MYKSEITNYNLFLFLEKELKVIFLVLRWVILLRTKKRKKHKKEEKLQTKKTKIERKLFGVKFDKINFLVNFCYFKKFNQNLKGNFPEIFL